MEPEGSLKCLSRVRYWEVELQKIILNELVGCYTLVLAVTR